MSTGACYIDEIHTVVYGYTLMKLFALERIDSRTVFPEHYDAFQALRELQAAPLVERPQPRADGVGAAAIFGLLAAEEAAGAASQAAAAITSTAERLRKSRLEPAELPAYYDFNTNLLQRVQLLFSRNQACIHYKRTSSRGSVEDLTAYTTNLLDIGKPEDAFGSPEAQLFVEGRIEVVRRQEPSHRGSILQAAHTVTEFGIATYIGRSSEETELRQLLISPMRHYDYELIDYTHYLEGLGSEGPPRIPPLVQGTDVEALLQLGDAMMFVEDRLEAQRSSRAV